MKNLIFKRNETIYEKKSEDYLVLLDVARRSLFCYKKDTKIVWDCIQGETTLHDLHNQLVSNGYEVAKEAIENLVYDMIKRAILSCDKYLPDEEYIEKNNDLNNYIEYCNTRNKVNSVLIEVTNMCNLKCVHCFHDMRISSLTLDTLENLFDDLKNTDILNITLTGGEITLYPYWKDVVELAYKNGIMVSIISNFTLMTDEDADYILNSGVSVVRTSVYGSECKLHDKITGIEGC